MLQLFVAAQHPHALQSGDSFWDSLSPAESENSVHVLTGSFTAGEAAELDPARQSHAAELSQEQLMQKLPEQLQQQFLSGNLPVSLDALRVSHGRPMPCVHKRVVLQL